MAGGGFLQGFTNQFNPAFQRGMSGYDGNAGLKKQLLELQLMQGQNAEARAGAQADRAAEQAKRQDNQLFGQLASEANQLVQGENARDALKAEGQLTPIQEMFIKAMPIEKRAGALADLTGVLSPGPSAIDLAKLDQTKADTELKRANAAKAKRPDRTSLEKNAIAAGLKPNTPEFRNFIVDSTLKPSTTVNLKNEGSIPPGHRAIRDPEGNITSLERISGAPTSEGDKKAAMFAATVETASKKLRAIEETGFNPVSPLNSARGIARTAQSEDAKIYEDNKNAWSESVIRARSGADAKDSEIQAVKETYFPVFGDGDAERKNKAELRKVLEEQMSSSGEAARVEQSAADIPVKDLQALDMDALLKMKEELMKSGNP